MTTSTNQMEIQMNKIEFTAALRKMYLILNAADTENKLDWTKPSDIQATVDLDHLIQKVFTPDEIAKFYDNM